MERKPWYPFYDPGVDLSPIYTDIPLKEQFISLVKKQPNKPYIYYLNKIITYYEANTSACRLANAMLDMGIKKGDRVVINLPNMPEFLIAAHACFKIGAIVVPTNPRYTKRELLCQYLNCKAETIICLDMNLNLNSEILLENQDVLKRIIVVSTQNPPFKVQEKEFLIMYKDLVEKGREAEPEEEALLDDIGLIIYTGGTTGVGKGCCITNFNLIAMASGWKQMCQYFVNLENYRVLSSTPMYHIHGFQTTFNANILIGGSIIIMPEITPDNILEAVNQYEPNVWLGVPALIGALCLHPKLAESKMNKLQHIGCGASSIPMSVMDKFESIVGVPIIEGYGASETSMAVASNPMTKRKAGSVGIPYPNTDCKVVDIVTGTKEVPLGQVGELCFKGPQIVKEYWQNPKETALNFQEGWWHSGDIGYMDEEGFIFILDRKKDMIICSGFNVYCSEVENILNSHPQILEAAVIGVPDLKRGETVKAYVVIKSGEKVSDLAIKDFCRKYLAAYKLPNEVEFINALPRTSVHKINRKALRALNSNRMKGFDSLEGGFK